MTKAIVRLLAALCGVLAALCFVEAIIVGTMPVDQAPALAWDADAQLLIHQPQQTGVRFPDGDVHHPVRYAINAQGWNAPADYTERDYRSHLAIVIGDSFVEALQVDPKDSISAVLEDFLDARTGQGRWRVYGMGMSGAPLSQYLQMARAAQRRYHPDIIVVVLVHNDFIESYQPPANRLYDSFWKTDGVKMIGPVVYRPTIGSRLMASTWATARLAVLSLRAHPAVDGSTQQMGIDTRAVLTAKTVQTTDYLFGQFARLAQHTSLLFVMDAPRDAIERGDDPHTSPVYVLNRMAHARALANGLRFLDLTQTFLDDQASLQSVESRSVIASDGAARSYRFRDGETHFSFRNDYHWNAYAHDLVARTLVPLVVHQ